MAGSRRRRPPWQSPPDHKSAANAPLLGTRGTVGSEALRIPVKLDLALIAARIVLVAALLPFAIGWRTPLFASWRLVALAVLLALPLALIAAEIWTLRRASSRALRAMSSASLALALLAFAATAAIEIDFQVKRRAVLAADL